MDWHPNSPNRSDLPERHYFILGIWSLPFGWTVVLCKHARLLSLKSRTETPDRNWKYVISGLSVSPQLGNFFLSFKAVKPEKRMDAFPQLGPFSGGDSPFFSDPDLFSPDPNLFMDQAALDTYPDDCDYPDDLYLPNISSPEPEPLQSMFFPGTEQDQDESIVLSAHVDGMEVKDIKRPSTRQQTPSQPLSQLPRLCTTPELDAENKSLFEHYVRRGQLPPPFSRTQLVQYIQREKVNAIVSEKYEDAQNLENVLKRLHQDIAKQESKNQNKRKLANLGEKLGNTNEVVAQIHFETNQFIKEELQKQAERKAELETRHEDDLDSFERRWNDPDFLKKFAKPSGELLTLKNKERSLILTKMFDEAGAVHERVAQLEQEESGNAQERAVHEMQTERSQVLEKHATELRIFEHHCQKEIQLIQREQERKLQAAQARQSKLESEIDDAKLGPSKSMHTELLHQTVMSPRTAKRYSAFKKVIVPAHIKIRPLGKIRPKKRFLF
jgi:hypothetical protein